ncbi:MAG: plasmid maintenance system antidote protein [Bacteroidota bacterium]
MDSNITLIKGIHPGIILERELKKRNLAKGRFALSINEYPQTLTSITKGNRKMNTALSLKIERALNMEEGYFMILQAYNDIELEKKKLTASYHPDLSLIRPVVFWDTDINSIDWDKNKSAVIQRIFERGNEQEIKEIIRFYGKEIVLSVLDSSGNLLPAALENKTKYL